MRGTRECVMANTCAYQRLENHDKHKIGIESLINYLTFLLQHFVVDRKSNIRLHAITKKHEE